MRTRKPQVFATNLHKNALEHDGPRTQRWHFALARATIRDPKATIRTTGMVVRVCWQLLHPPSKIENRRLLIKKNLLNATSIQQVCERKTQPKAIAPNRPRRAAIPRQKMPLGGLAAAFSSLAGRKHDYGASRGASESQKKPEKERRSAKSDRKAPKGAPNAMLDPCSEAPYRRFLPSCEQNRATAASPQRKNLLNATSI